MTMPDESLPYAGSAEPASEHDPEYAEEYAESVSIDPTPEEVDHYRELIGDPDLPEDPDLPTDPDFPRDPNVIGDPEMPVDPVVPGGPTE
jgi:hypothetical protein